MKAGDIPRAQVDASARRILEAKARLGLHRTRTINLEGVPLTVGGRKHDAVARAVSERAVTLLKDARNQRAAVAAAHRQPAVSLGARLSIGVAHRRAEPARSSRSCDRAGRTSKAIEVSDRTTPAELDLVRAMAENYDAIVAGVFVRASSASGRLDLAPQVIRLLQDLSRRQQPLVAAFFGNPYTPMFVPELPAMLLTYDFSDYAEQSAVKAIAGEIAIGGKLPITLPGLFPLGHGLTRAVASR